MHIDVAVGEKARHCVRAAASNRGEGSGMQDSALGRPMGSNSVAKGVEREEW
jgi:hypothetical protein